MPVGRFPHLVEEFGIANGLAPTDIKVHPVCSPEIDI